MVRMGMVFMLKIESSVFFLSHCLQTIAHVYIHINTCIALTQGPTTHTTDTYYA